jgi:hypothetical protein
MKSKKVFFVLSFPLLTSLLFSCGGGTSSSDDSLVSSSANSTVSSVPSTIDSLYWTSSDGYGVHYLEGYLGNETDIVIPSSVGGVSINVLDNFLFANHTNLKTVVIPAGISQIAESVFSGCTSLNSVTFQGSVSFIGGSAFKDCLSLKSISIPSSVSVLGANAFAGCTGLTSLTLPSSLSYLNNYAFQGCTSLISFSISSANASFSVVDGVLFNKDQTILLAMPGGRTGAYTIPSMVKTIQNGAFFGCSLSSVSIPASVTHIDDAPFQGCSKLTSISVDEANTVYASKGGVLFSKDFTSLLSYPNGLSGDYAIPSTVTSLSLGFYQSTGLTSLSIPAGLVSFDATSFYECSALTSVTVDSANEKWSSNENCLFSKDLKTLAFVPNGIKGSYSVPAGTITIGVGAFHGCSQISDIVLATTTTSFGAGAFYGCSSLESFTCPSGMYYIEAYSFYDCLSLTNVVLPTKLYAIREYAFYGCKALTSADLGTGLTSLGKACFQGCSSLTSILIPATLTLLPSFGFYGCSSLAAISFSGYVSSFGTYCFAGCSGLTSVSIPETTGTATTNPPNVTLSESAFYNCVNLTSVVLPTMTTFVGARCFANDAKGSFYFATSSLNNVTLTTGWNINSGFGYAYSESQPTQSGHYWHYVNSIPTAW